MTVQRVYLRYRLKTGLIYTHLCLRTVMVTSQRGLHPTCIHCPDMLATLQKSMTAFLSSAAKVREQQYEFSHVYTVGFIKGVEKLNDVSKRMFFRSSNKLDPTADMIINKYKLMHLQRTCERRKRPYMWVHHISTQSIISLLHIHIQTKIGLLDTTNKRKATGKEKNSVE